MPVVYLLSWSEQKIAYVGATGNLSARIRAHINGQVTRTADTVRQLGAPAVQILEETEDRDTQKLELAYARTLRANGWEVLNRPRGGWAPYLGQRGAGDRLKRMHEDKLPSGKSKHAVWVGSAYGRQAALAQAERYRREGPTAAQVAGHSEDGRQGGIKTSKLRRQCMECGLVTNPGNITRHQQRTGHSGFMDKDIRG